MWLQLGFGIDLFTFLGFTFLGDKLPRKVQKCGGIHADVCVRMCATNLGIDFLVFWAIHCLEKWTNPCQSVWKYMDINIGIDFFTFLGDKSTRTKQ